MEKLNIENANKLFAAVYQKFDTPEIVEYKVGEEIVNVEIFSTINVKDKQTLIEAACIAAENDDEGSEIFRDCIIASTIIEYLTNIPLPKSEIDGVEQTDLFVCHEIVFGNGGLAELSRTLWDLILDVQCEVNERLQTTKKKPVDVLCENILELMELAKYELNDIAENPVRQEEFLRVIEGMKKSDE